MSAFNLSSLAAMQDEHLEQASVHFWRCQLTAENPRHAWDPCGSGGEAKANGDEKVPPAEDKKNEDDDDDEDDDVTVRHLLQVTGCVLPPQASGVHLITVRTSCYQKQQQQQQQKPTEPAATACPIVCIDPLVQRTLALGHEFVPGSSGTGSSIAAAAAAAPVVFELAEGTGPVWLTGTHRVHRVTRLTAPWCCDDEDEDGEEATGDEVDDEVEAGDADPEEEEKADVEDASDAEEAGEEDEEEDEDSEEEEEKKAAKGKGKAKGPAAGVKITPAAGKKQQQQQQQQQQRRKRAKPDS